MKMGKSLAAVVATGVAFTLTACGTPSSENGGSSSETIVWNMWAAAESDIEALQAQLEIARAENPDIEIKLQHAPWDDYFTKLTTNLSSGDVACITAMNGQRLSGYHEAFMPLTDADLKTAGIDKADFTDGSLDIMSYDGELYGLPYDVAAMTVFYNKDMFAETGTPEPAAGWSFDDFDAAVKSTTTDEHPGFGMAMSELQWMALPIAKAGTQPVDESGALTLDDPAFVEASEWYARMAEDGYGSVPPSAAETSWGEQEYQAGNVAMAVDGTWNAVTYLNNEAGFEAGMADLPSQDGERLGLVLGSGYGISKDCENKEAALKVLGSLVGEQAQNQIASSGRSYPARTSSQPLYFESLDAGVRDEVEKAFDAAFSNLEGQRSTPDWAEINEAITPDLVSVYTGRTTISDVLEQTQQQFGE
ncbi:ABC transporter substrate-binding protein [Streptomyces blattellae]|uniref:ABC transporter substrate-binding protein n=1 Tax=Streptomyces blattellae TaxID=2569855 RepID=UPI001E474704|nr:sugar ABC transporter substrate-binding protein [Streptomyces blattellae]